MRVVQSEGAPAAIGPYSHAIVAGELVFTSGVIGSDPATGELVAADVDAQTRQALANLEAILKSAGSGLHRVVKCTVFLQSMGDFAAMNAIYAERFGAHRPARSTIEVAALPKRALVEIEAVAMRIA